MEHPAARVASDKRNQGLYTGPVRPEVKGVYNSVPEDYHKDSPHLYMHLAECPQDKAVIALDRGSVINIDYHD